MSTRSELEFLDYVQDEAERLADEAEPATAIERREFVFITAAASTFGFGARALAQGGAATAQAPQQPPLPPLGNGETMSWTFQPYPGGTGALMEKLVRERGPAAFQRATFTVPKWTGAVPNDPETIAFLPGAGAGRGRACRRRDPGWQVSRPAARHSVRREGPVLDEGHAHDVGLEGFREPRH